MTFGVRSRNLAEIVHLFGCTAGQMAAPLIGLQQDLVRQHIELLLRLTLNIAGAGIAKYTAPCALVDGMRDRLTGAGAPLDQHEQIHLATARAPLLNHETGMGYRIDSMTQGSVRTRQRCDHIDNTYEHTTTNRHKYTE